MSTPNKIGGPFGRDGGEPDSLDLAHQRKLAVPGKPEEVTPHPRRTPEQLRALGAFGAADTVVDHDPDAALPFFEATNED